MFRFLRTTIWLILLAQITTALAQAQSAAGVVSPSNVIPKAGISTCDRVPGPHDFRLQLSMPPSHWPGLNMTWPVCSRESQIKFAAPIPQFLEHSPTKGGPPVFCGILYSSVGPIRVCTKG